MSDDKIIAELQNRGIAYPPCGFSVGDGWVPIVLETLDRMIAAGWNRELAQVKEKFGGLRIYIGAAVEEVHSLTAEAEEQCWKTCEKCGSTADVETKPSPRWIMALCSKCRTI